MDKFNLTKKQLKKLNDIKMEIYYHSLEKKEAVSKIKSVLAGFPENHHLKNKAEWIYSNFKEEIENYL